MLDEPFSSLDVELREQLARQVRRILKQEGVTALMVSHHQQEAFSIADRIGVMHQGRLLQWDTAFRLYHQPNCAEIADFIGEGLFLSGKVMDRQTVATGLGEIRGAVSQEYSDGETVRVLIRPDDILHDDDSPMKAKVLNKVFRGASFLYTLGLDGRQPGAEPWCPATTTIPWGSRSASVWRSIIWCCFPNEPRQEPKA